MQKQEPLTSEQQKFVLDNISLIYHVANPLKRKGIPADVFDDLCGYLFYRLCVCATRWDPSRNNTISTYVINCLNGEIKNFFRDRTWASGIRPPRSIRETTFVKIVEGDELNQSEAERKGHNPHTVRSCAQPISLDAIGCQDTDESEFRAEVLAAPNDTEKEVVEKIGGPALVQEVMNALCSTDRTILKMLMEGTSISEIQAYYQISRPLAIQVCELVRSRVRNLYFSALEGKKLPEPEENYILNQAIRRKFSPPRFGWAEIYRRAIRNRVDPKENAA